MGEKAARPGHRRRRTGATVATLALSDVSSDINQAANIRQSAIGLACDTDGSRVDSDPSNES